MAKKKDDKKDNQDEENKDDTGMAEDLAGDGADAEGGEGEDGEGAGEGEGGGSKKKLFIIIGAAVVLLLAGGGAAAYFTGMLDGLLGKESPMEEASDAHGDSGDGHGDHMEFPDEDVYGDEEYGYEEDHSADMSGGGHGGEEAASGGGGHGAASGGEGGGGGNFVEIPTMLVNLNTDDGTPRYLRLTVQVELKSPGDYSAVEAVIPRVVDQFQTYLRELRVKDLRGSAGIYRLQMELLWRVNQAARPVRVKDVLFQEILIQ